MPLGNSSATRVGDPVVVGGAGGRSNSVAAKIVAKQEFAGYWEYLLDEAIFTAPAHPMWGGAGLIGVDGALLGIGSLRLQMASGDGAQDINMFVPINLLPPVMDDLLKFGRVNQDPRPWLGVYAADSDGRVVTMNVDPRGPAAKAGLQQGDVIADVRDSAVDDLAGLYRAIWGCGPAGVEIPLRIVRNKRDMWLRI
ncbi:MAG: serine protease, partial [Planctomycetes bacterium]|nr:serine protease [Planctomycetota bacterium]